MLKRCFLLVCVALALSGVALADHESDPWSPWPYTMESADKRYIFVMLRSCLRDEGVYSEKYSESGLYQNDGSTTPLWTVDWHKCSKVFLPSDGVHVVRMDSPDSADGSEESYTYEAITFFAGGRRLKSYQVCDLVTIPWLLPHAVGQHGYKWWRPITAEKGGSKFTIVEWTGGKEVPGESGVVFDESAHTMTLETLQGDSYLFDLNTGEIVSATRPLRTITVWLLALFVLFYVWYLKRATASPRLPWWKLYQRLAFGALVMAWLLTLLGVGLGSAGRLAHVDFNDDPLFWVMWRVVGDLPMEFAPWREWWWPSPYGTFPGLYRVQRLLSLMAFWFSGFALAGLASTILVRCLRSIRQRWISRGSGPSSGVGPEATAARNLDRLRFKEVQHYSHLCLGFVAFSLSIWAALDLSWEMESWDIRSDPIPILIFVLMGCLVPVFLLNVKMVTRVRDDEVLVGLRLLWFQRRKISFAEIRQCSIQPRHSNEHDELMVRRYAVWAPLGVLIELKEGDWILIGSQRPKELLDAIRVGQSKTPSG